MKKLFSLVLMSAFMLCSCKQAESYVSENLDKDLSNVQSEITNQIEGTTEPSMHKDIHTMAGSFKNAYDDAKWPEKDYYIQFHVRTAVGSETTPYDGNIYYCDDPIEDILVGDKILINSFDSYMHTIYELTYREDIGVLFVVIDGSVGYVGADLQGVWIYADDSTKDSYTFKEDGTGSLVVYKDSADEDNYSEKTFTYVVHEDVLEINFDGFTRTFPFTIRIDNNTLYITDESDITEVYTREG